MEVHHHPKAPGKGWKHLLLEFTMLFVAVTAGTFAENQREHIVERHRAAEFAQSLYDDIRADTAGLHMEMAFSKSKEDSCTEAIEMLHLPREQWNDTTIYSVLSYVSRLLPFEPSEGTYEQIRASGSLRYFNPVMVQLMNSYDVQAKKVMEREHLHVDFIINQYTPFLVKHFNVEAVHDIRFGLPHKHNMKINIDEQAKLELINQLATVRMLRMRTVLEYEQMLKLADKNLAELKKDYNPKEKDMDAIED